MWKVAPWESMKNSTVETCSTVSTKSIVSLYHGDQSVPMLSWTHNKSSGQNNVIFLSCKVKQGRGKQELLSPSAQEYHRHPLCSAVLHLVAKQQIPQMTRVNRVSVSLRMLQWNINVKCGGILVSWCQEIRTEKRWRSDKTQYATIDTVGPQLAHTWSIFCCCTNCNTHSAALHSFTYLVVFFQINILQWTCYWSSDL